MSDNPYATPPAAGSVPQSIEKRYVYRPATLLVTLVTLFLLCDMVLSFLLGVMSVVEGLYFLEGVAETDELVAADFFYLGYGCLGLTELLSLLCCVILFCMWVYRANANARALGAEEMRFSPGWSVGWFFIPIANLFVPFQAVNEIYRASDPEHDGRSWKTNKTPALLGWWWGFWLVNNFVSNLEGRLAFSDDINLLKVSALAGHCIRGSLPCPPRCQQSGSSAALIDARKKGLSDSLRPRLSGHRKCLPKEGCWRVAGLPPRTHRPLSHR